MSVIRILPEAVANKIAAGEVVERPASVVKELVENALDAGASRVEVYVEAGGKRVIRVEDDGVGMTRDDVLLAFERHATSKIKSIEDLFEVATLGFRGEALPSIAAVSRLMLKTRHASEASGTQLEIAGGRLRNVTEVPWPCGTQIEVSNLFYNTPARRKFLKTESTELGHVASLVTHYALAHPEKSFRLASFTHEILNAPPVSTFRERIYHVMGGQTLEQLVEIAPVERAMIVATPPGVSSEEAATPAKVGLCGFISRPEVQKLNRNQIYFFVNRRLVRDRLILHAITEAYRNILPAGMFPVALIFLELPPSEVDVNVHPSKTEVRFRNSSFVHDFARDSIRGALIAARPMAAFPMRDSSRRAPADDTEAEMAERLGEDSSSDSGGWQGPVARAAGEFQEPARGSSVADFRLSSPQPVPQSGVLPLAPGEVLFRGLPGEDSAGLARSWQVSGDLEAAHGVVLPRHPPGLDACSAASTYSKPEADTSSPTSSDEFPRNLRPLGQVHDSFIVATNDVGLWIIDQHVAHERVLFERHLKMRQEKKVEGQRLLLPIVVELNPEQQATFQDIAQELAANGFDAEPFGQRTVAIKTAPGEVRAEDAERLLLEILDGAGPEGRLISLDTLLHRIAASVACHAAIKVNMPLTQGKMEWLLRELQKTDCPMTCPHGRPILLRYSLKDIEKAFKRI
jgi:DNA mismatch repair protein MutL